MMLWSPSQLAKDLMYPSFTEERRRHKKKRLVQHPNSYFMDVKCPGNSCTITRFTLWWTVIIITNIISRNRFIHHLILPGCYRISTIFSHAQQVVPCVGCSVILCQPGGGKCRLTAGEEHDVGLENCCLRCIPHYTRFPVWFWLRAQMQTQHTIAKWWHWLSCNNSRGGRQATSQEQRWTGWYVCETQGWLWDGKEMGGAEQLRGELWWTGGELQFYDLVSHDLKHPSQALLSISFHVKCLSIGKCLKSYCIFVFWICVLVYSAMPFVMDTDLSHCRHFDLSYQDNVNDDDYLNVTQPSLMLLVTH